MTGFRGDLLAVWFSVGGGSIQKSADLDLDAPLGIQEPHAVIEARVAGEDDTELSLQLKYTTSNGWLSASRQESSRAARALVSRRRSGFRSAITFIAAIWRSHVNLPQPHSQ